MARPRKNNADYFSHDKGMRDDPKIKAIRQRFGSDGYAAWCMLLETLTDANNLEIEYNELEVELLAGDFGINSDRLEEIISSFRRLKLISIEGERLFCSKLIERMQGLFEIRERKRQWSEQKKTPNNELRTSKTEFSTSKTHQSKDKDKDKVKREESENAHAENEPLALEEIKKNHPPNSAAPPSALAWQPADPDAELDEMLVDDMCKERFFRQCRIPLDKFQPYIEAFRLKVKSEQATHSNRRDFRSHFFSWASLEFARNQKQENGSPKLTFENSDTIAEGLDFAERFAAERAARRRGA